MFTRLVLVCSIFFYLFCSSSCKTEEPEMMTSKSLFIELYDSMDNYLNPQIGQMQPFSASNSLTIDMYKLSETVSIYAAELDEVCLIDTLSSLILLIDEIPRDTLHFEREYMGDYCNLINVTNTTLKVEQIIYFAHVTAIELRE